MKIAVIGVGYVGLVSGVCFSDFGHHVVCVDKDPRKIETLEQGELPIYEPGLDVLLAKNTAAGRLSFTTELSEALDGADAVFIAVGTPTRRGDGHADLSYVLAAATEVAQTLKHYSVIIIKSTVPVGTNQQLLNAVRPSVVAERERGLLARKSSSSASTIGQRRLLTMSTRSLETSIAVTS